MKLPFYKMQGAGNDYIYVNGFEFTPDDPAALSRRISARHFGVGGDGLILLLPSDKADLRMQIFNADGSEAQMCGNGIRCVGKLAYELGIAPREVMTVDTRAGVKTLWLTVEGGRATQARVFMGAPSLSAASLPADTREEQLVDFPLGAAGEVWRITCVSMGNPHAVTFTTGIDALDLPRIGPAFERHALFPERVNTEFIEVLDAHTLRMRVWERGSGETLACGTGACASVVAACVNGHVGRGEDVTVHLRGGDLIIRWADDGVYMTGPAVLVFTGEIEI